MLYKDLDRKWKLSISGSINNALKNISSDADFDAAYDYWYEGKFEEAEGRIQFVKIITDDRLDIDEELLCDIKKIFKERFDKKVDRKKDRDVKRVERQKEEAASDKQLKYARKLYRKVYGEEKGFDDREYSKFEMIGIIGELKEKLEDVKDEKYGDFKVIEFKRQ